MPNKNKSLLKLSTLYLALISSLYPGLNNKAHAREFFDPSFINATNGSGTADALDLSIFQTRNAQSPGVYRVDVIFNGRYLETKDINFVVDETASDDGDQIKLTPCINKQMLSEYGVKVNSFPTLQENQQGCANLDVIPGDAANLLI